MSFLVCGSINESGLLDLLVVRRAGDRQRHLISYFVLNHPVLLLSGRAQEAVQFHSECLELRQEIYGYHPTLGSCYNNLSEAYEKMGDLRRALEAARIGMNIKTYFIKDPSNAVIDSYVTVARLTIKTCESLKTVFSPPGFHHKNVRRF